MFLSILKIAIGAILMVGQYYMEPIQRGKQHTNYRNGSHQINIMFLSPCLPMTCIRCAHIGL